MEEKKLHGDSEHECADGIQLSRGVTATEIKTVVN